MIKPLASHESVCSQAKKVRDATQAKKVKRNLAKSISSFFNSCLDHVILACHK